MQHARQRPIGTPEKRPHVTRVGAVARSQRAPALRMGAEVEGKLKEIVAEQLGVEQTAITGTANFASDLGADSLDVVEMVMKIEEAFGIELPDERAEIGRAHV